MSDREATMEIPDKAFARPASCAAAPVGVLAFWGGMLMAAQRYPFKVMDNASRWPLVAGDWGPGPPAVFSLSMKDPYV
jgi:hypothetical protein